MPSSYEGFGAPVIEAMACGTPVVAVRNPGAREIVRDGHTGLLCSDATLAANLIAALKDAGIRERLSANGIEDVRARFDIMRIAQRYAALYTKIATDGTAP